MEKQIRQISQAEQRVKLELKQLLKKENASEQPSVRILARELARTQKLKDNLQTTITQMNSISMQLSEQISMVRVSGTFESSTDITKMMNSCVSKQLPGMQVTMQSMQKEMIKAGIMEEMVSEAFEDAMEPNVDLDDVEVDAILSQLQQRPLSTATTASKLSTGPLNLPSSPSNVPSASPRQPTAAGPEDVQKSMQARLNALR